MLQRGLSNEILNVFIYVCKLLNQDGLPTTQSLGSVQNKITFLYAAMARPKCFTEHPTSTRTLNRLSQQIPQRSPQANGFTIPGAAVLQHRRGGHEAAQKEPVAPGTPGRDLRGVGLRTSAGATRTQVQRASKGREC